MQNVSVEPSFKLWGRLVQATRWLFSRPSKSSRILLRWRSKSSEILLLNTFYKSRLNKIMLVQLWCVGRISKPLCSFKAWQSWPTVASDLSHLGIDDNFIPQTPLDPACWAIAGLPLNTLMCADLPLGKALQQVRYRCEPPSKKSKKIQEPGTENLNLVQIFWKELLLHT